jgi:hypothetical protein
MRPPDPGLRVPYDLVAMKAVPYKILPDGRYQLALSMERFGGMLVAWIPEEVRAVTLAPLAVAKVGQPWHATATIMGIKPIPGTLAVQFTLTDPQGKIPPLSGVRQAQNGVATFDWTPAVNDLLGTWTLAARELVTGKTVTGKFKVSR